MRGGTAHELERAGEAIGRSLRGRPCRFPSLEAIADYVCARAPTVWHVEIQHDGWCPRVPCSCSPFFVLYVHEEPS